jgi:hypothetical protein
MCWHCITVESYCSKLERLQQVICYTHPRMLHQHIINLHDNASPTLPGYSTVAGRLHTTLHLTDPVSWLVISISLWST